MKISWFTTSVFVSIPSSSFAPQAFAFTSSSSLSKPFKTAFASHLPVFILHSPKPSVRRLSMSSAPDQSFFKDVIYNQSKATNTAVPWDIQRHQPALEKVQSMFKGNILDVGTGTGDNARWLASLPTVTSVKAVDLAPLAIQEAMSRVAIGGAPLEFQEANIFEPHTIAPNEFFDTLLDSAVYHCIGNDDDQRRYLKCVTSLVKVGGKVVMLVFSDENPAETWRGPRRINALEAKNMWQEAGWNIDSMDTTVHYMDSMGRCDGKGGHALLMCATRES
jgi:2-polyprenyl-3-methyl-5-hydroxy-6-metoxy-1,4-benzoquinol methylase